MSFCRVTRVSFASHGIFHCYLTIVTYIFCDLHVLFFRNRHYWGLLKYYICNLDIFMTKTSLDKLTLWINVPWKAALYTWHSPQCTRNGNKASGCVITLSESPVAMGLGLNNFNVCWSWINLDKKVNFVLASAQSELVLIYCKRQSMSNKSSGFCYHPRMRAGNNFSRVCLCICVST